MQHSQEKKKLAVIAAQLCQLLLPSEPSHPLSRVSFIMPAFTDVEQRGPEGVSLCDTKSQS